MCGAPCVALRSGDKIASELARGIAGGHRGVDHRALVAWQHSLIVNTASCIFANSTLISKSLESVALAQTQSRKVKRAATFPMDFCAKNRLDCSGIASGFATGKGLKHQPCMATGCSFPSAEHDRLQIRCPGPGGAPAHLIRSTKGQLNCRPAAPEPFIVGTK